MNVPFFRPSIGDSEIAEVVDTLRSGWLTTGPRVQRFEEAFARSVGASSALAVNSCTAALHLSVDALGLRAGQAVLVPTVTFAATAEVVRYQGAVPILVDCDPITLNMSLGDASEKLQRLASGSLDGESLRDLEVKGMIPVHVGGFMMDGREAGSFAERHGLWLVEDAAHAFPAAWREEGTAGWRQCGAGSADSTCFSFYANKTITTGEGGMVVTSRLDLMDRLRLMSLHGLSKDAWDRYSGGATWDYRIVAPGYKYNMTDVAAAIGIHQLLRAENLRQERERIASRYIDELASVNELDLPAVSEDRVHSWHLFVIRLNLERLRIDRNTFVEKLRKKGVGCSVHWRPLHLHPYYQETYSWKPESFPVAGREWMRLISLPIFPGMLEDEFDHVVTSVRQLCARWAK